MVKFFMYIKKSSCLSLSPCCAVYKDVTVCHAFEINKRVKLLPILDPRRKNQLLTVNACQNTSPLTKNNYHEKKIYADLAHKELLKPRD